VPVLDLSRAHRLPRQKQGHQRAPERQQQCPEISLEFEERLLLTRVSARHGRIERALDFRAFIVEISWIPPARARWFWVCVRKSGRIRLMVIRMQASVPIVGSRQWPAVRISAGMRAVR
jgi:hypothetical protein